MESDLAYRLLLWHGAEKIKSKNIEGKKMFEDVERRKTFEVESFGQTNSVIQNHIDSDSIRVDQNNADSNQLITANSKKIGSINDSSDIREIKKYYHCCYI